MKHPPILRLLLALLLALTATAATAHDFQVDGIFYEKNSDGTVNVTNDPHNFTRYSGSVTIPSQVTYKGTTYSVTGIGYKAFQYCDDLTSVTIPNSVTWIGGLAFYCCTGLTSVTIGNSVTYIGLRAFHGCRCLTSVTIPNSVTAIGDYAFESCRGLISVTIGNSVTKIGEGAFRYCSGLTSLTIGSSVTEIGYYAFQNCSGLTSVTIPNSVTTIGYAAFADCTNIKSLTLGSALRYIDPKAFVNCPNISTIVIRAVDPPSFSDSHDNHYYNYFDQSVYNNAYLYVPEESLSKYESRKFWSDFRFIYGKKGLGVEDVSNDNEVTFSVEGGLLNCGGVYTEVYTLTGAKVYGSDGEVELAAGVYIVVANGRATKVYIK